MSDESMEFSQEIDLRSEKCPMNLVKFKNFFHVLQSKNITNGKCLLPHNSNATKSISYFLDTKDVDHQVSHLETHDLIEFGE